MQARSAPSALSFDQAPPIAVPFRFFLTAPLFLVLAGVLLLVEGSAALASRWQPQTLALVHLFVAGFLLQIMAGAVLQFVPVVTGGNVRRPRVLAVLTHPLLAVGALALVAGFLGGDPLAFRLAALLLGGGGLLLVLAVGMALYRAQAQGATLGNLRLAMAALGVTIALGVMASLMLGGVVSVPLVALVNAHGLWGLAGWGLLLLGGVSGVVVPMFQMTRPYAPRVVLAVRWGVGLALVLAVLPLLGVMPEGATFATLVALATLSIHAVATLRLQAQRRRRVPDHVLSLFRVGMVAALLAAVLAVGLAVLSPVDGRGVVLAGVWIILGVFGSTVLGMIYKIVPFLVWLHLQGMPGMRPAARAGGKAEGRPLPPDMNSMIPPSWARVQRGVQVAALLLLSIGPWLDGAARAGGAVLVLGAVALWVSMARATLIYRRFSREIDLRSRTPADAAPTEC